MWKDKVRSLRDYIIRHSKVAFPLIIIVAVAVTVAVALKAGNADAKVAELEQPTEPVQDSTGEAEGASLERVIPDIPLEQSTDGAMYSLMATYYNALATGDVDTVKSVKNYVEDTEEIRIRELSKYIESYPAIEIYTKPGPEPASYIAYVYTKVTFYGYDVQVPGLQTFYVCTDENGNLFLNEGEVAEDILDYIKEINFQDDVVELNNRVNVEYNELCLNNKKMFEYIAELEAQVSKATGEALAAQIADPENASQENPEDTAQAGASEGSENPEVTPAAEPTPEPQQQQGPLSATATTTVNVRSSDSENAEKLGKIAGGTQVQVTEQRANGWSKIVYEGQDGYVKSEYLQVNGTAAETGETNQTSASIGTAVATTNVNVRASASESAEKIGVVTGGESVELLSEENGWYKISHNGQTGYVKADYLQK